VPAPVEVKGYKNVINLPDWIYLQNIIDKLKKKVKTTEFIFTGFLQNIIQVHRGIGTWSDRVAHSKYICVSV
jgi:hypothetical protein